VSYYLENPELEEGQKDIITRIKDIMGLEVDCYYDPNVDQQPKLRFENVDQEGQKKLQTLCRWVRVCNDTKNTPKCEAHRERATFPLELIMWSVQFHSLYLYEGSYNGPEGAYSLLEEMLGGKEPKLKSFD
jgi:hypothetical protein